MESSIQRGEREMGGDIQSENNLSPEEYLAGLEAQGEYIQHELKPLEDGIPPEDYELPPDPQIEAEEVPLADQAESEEAGTEIGSGEENPVYLIESTIQRGERDIAAADQPESVEIVEYEPRVDELAGDEQPKLEEQAAGAGTMEPLPGDQDDAQTGAINYPEVDVISENDQADDESIVASPRINITTSAVDNLPEPDQETVGGTPGELPEYELADLSDGFLPLPAELPGQELASLSVADIEQPRRIALVLSGGGARGAFQVGAEKYCRDVKGYHWDIIAGVSVGALNGAMLAMHRYQRLMEIWDSISDNKVYTGGFNLLSVARLLFGARSFYGNEPLQKIMEQEFEAGKVVDDLRVGAVSLISGEYVTFTKESLELARAILASTAIPVVWEPVDISPEYPAMVDGGVRNISPLGDVIALEPDEVVVINCGGEKPAVSPEAATNVLSIGMRALDIMQSEIFVNDMREFLRINALVQEAEKLGCVLHHPKTGRPYKYFPCQVIEPLAELGGVMDFSQASIQASLRAGVRRAREVLGRP